MNKKKRRGRKCWRGIWNKKGKREIKVNRLEIEERKLDEDWESVEKRIKGMIEKIKKAGQRKEGREDGEMRIARRKRER